MLNFICLALIVFQNTLSSFFLLSISHTYLSSFKFALILNFLLNFVNFIFINYDPFYFLSVFISSTLFVFFQNHCQRSFLFSFFCYYSIIYLLSFSLRFPVSSLRVFQRSKISSFSHVVFPEII